MIRVILAIAAGAVVISASVASAEPKSDMAEVTCDDLPKMSLEEFSIVSTWMNGYHSAKRNNTKVDIKQLVANTRSVLEFCNKNPKMTVMKAVEQVAK